MRHLRVLLSFTILAAAVLASSAVGAQSLDEIAETIDRSGRYTERDLQSVALDAVDRANGNDIAFVYLDQENAEDLPIIAAGLLDRLDALGSGYRTLIVLDTSGVWVQSLDRDTGRAVDAATPQFANGAVAGGIDTVVAELNGGVTNNSSTGSATTAGVGDDTGASATEEAAAPSSGGGVPWLLVFLLGVITFFVVRFFLGRKRKAAALEAALAEDRAEIREQLRNNSDHVIDLGERIANADDDLRRRYEEAAQTYQDVSLGLDDAATAAEIDALDDRLDRAEWQFEVIEARLDGRTPPPEPRPGGVASTRPPGRQPVPPLGADQTPPPPGPRQPTGRSGRSLGDDRPALGSDESVFPGGPSRRGRTAPAPRGRRSGGGGMLGGMAKAGLLSLVLKLLLGGGLNPGNASRRTQQRHGAGGRVGGGVLR